MESSPDQALDELYARFIWSNIFLAATGQAQPTLEDESDAESVASEDSCRVDLLHESPDSRKRGRLLDALAQLLSYKRGWHHVTATAIESRADRHIRFRITRNGVQNDKERERDRAFLEALRLWVFINFVAQESSAESASERFLPVAIKYNIYRHADNRRDLQKFFEHIPIESESLRRGTNPDGVPASLLHARKLKRSLLDSTQQSSSMELQAELVKYAFVKLKTMASDKGDNTEAKLLCTYTSSPREALHMLGMLARPLTNLIVLAKVFWSLYQGHTFEFLTMPAPVPWHLPPKHVIGAAQAWELLELPSKTLGRSKVLLRDADKPSDGNSFLDMCRKPMHVHAEVQLVSFYSEYPEDRPSEAYLGCSKRSCVTCTNSMKLDSQGFYTKQSHHRVHPQWMVPTDEMSQYAEAIKVMTGRTVERIRAHVTCLPADTKNVKFEKQSIGTMTATVLEESVDRDLIQSRSQTERPPGVPLHDSLAIGSDAVDDVDWKCCNTDCIAKASARCRGCKNARYCSEDCERSDWPLHKQVCQQWSKTLEVTSGATVVLVFAPNLRRVTLSAVYNVDDLVSSFTYEERVSTNMKHGHALENHILVLSNSTPRPHHVERTRSDDISPTQNRALAHLVGRDGTEEKPGALWPGTVMAVWCNVYDVLTSASFVNFQPHFLRHLRDFFVEFGNENVDRPFTDGRQTTIGIKMNCKGERIEHEVDYFESVNIPLDHPIWLTDSTPISAQVGFPIKIRRYVTEGDTAGHEEPANQPITFLHQNITDNEDELLGYGWAPWEWQDFVGTALVVRQDQQPLTQKDIEAMCDFCQYHLGTRFEYALESRDRGPVEDAMTPEAYQAFRLTHKMRAKGNTKAPYPTDDKDEFWTPERLHAHERLAIG